MMNMNRPCRVRKASIRQTHGWLTVATHLKGNKDGEDVRHCQQVLVEGQDPDDPRQPHHHNKRQTGLEPVPVGGGRGGWSPGAGRTVYGWPLTWLTQYESYSGASSCGVYT